MLLMLLRVVHGCRSQSQLPTARPTPETAPSWKETQGERSKGEIYESDRMLEAKKSNFHTCNSSSPGSLFGS
jgi:hypothetical protein